MASLGMPSSPAAPGTPGVKMSCCSRQLYQLPGCLLEPCEGPGSSSWPGGARGWLPGQKFRGCTRVVRVFVSSSGRGPSFGDPAGI